MSEDYPEVMTVEEASVFLRVSEGTLYNLLNDGRLPGRKVGRAWRIRKQALLDYLMKREDGEEEQG